MEIFLYLFIVRKIMEEFGKKYNLTYLQVRTRIINTRRINKIRKEKLKRKMNVS